MFTPRQFNFEDDGRIPNSRLPVLLYVAALDVSKLEREGAARAFEQLFAAHGWPPDWRDGIYDYTHYHSTAHEAMGVAAGTARLRLGGHYGKDLSLAPGDALVLPAGTGHCCWSCDADFLVVGAYPKGQHWDVMLGAPRERPAALERIARVSLPETDPVGGELPRLWHL